MERYLLTESTNSIEEFTKSLGFLLPGSIVRSKVASGNFSSEGLGILSKGFYLGNNKTKHLAELELINVRSCIFSIPLKGHYTTAVSNKLLTICNPDKGCLFLPDISNNAIKYTTDLDEIDDLVIIIKYDEIKSLLLKNYNIETVDESQIELDLSNIKVKLIYDLIINKMRALECYPHLGDSLHFMSSVKEVAKLFLTEIIADSMQVELRRFELSDIKLLKNVEMLIDEHPEFYSSIHDIANKANTTPRKLQLLFKKHRSYTPMQFLKERKLHMARLALINSNLETVVKQVAIDSGFTNMSSFSKDYRILFGELPSKTIELARDNFFLQ